MTDSITVSSLRAFLTRLADLVAENAAHLTELDAAIGDADHGANLKRGFAAVADAIDGAEFATTDELMKKVGMTLVSSVGGASGPLYGTFFLRLGTAVPGEAELSAEQFAQAFAAGVQGVAERGKAEAGDKTMLDALKPAAEAITAGASTKPLPQVLADALTAAEQGRDSVTDSVAKKGRASYVGERAIGHVDPGAESAVLLVQALSESISEEAAA